MPPVSGRPIGTWFRGETEEDGMLEDHAYLWRHMIEAVPEKDFRSWNVLDYGCNRGGFFGELYKERPFRHGVGVDVAEVSLAKARKRHAQLPVAFITPQHMQRYTAHFDIAFSHEVLYLLPDLAAHGAAVAQSLKRAASYYAAIGCHTGNPLWPLWRTLIAEATNLPVFDYSLDDYARAFRLAGLTVYMRPFYYRDFIFIKPNNAYFPTAANSLVYHTEVKTILRATKAG